MDLKRSPGAGAYEVERMVKFNTFAFCVDRCRGERHAAGIDLKQVALALCSRGTKEEREGW